MRNGCIGLPCAKFCAAFALTAGSFIFGCTMIATGGTTASLAPFYCSLISGAISYWAQPPSYNEDSTQTGNDENSPLVN